MTIPYPKQASFYKVFIVDNYHQTLKELDTVFPDKEAAARYGSKYIKDLSNLTEDERVHADDIHVYFQTVSMEHVACPYHDSESMLADKSSFVFCGEWKVK